jgi:SAM-dependent methyltransferase
MEKQLPTALQTELKRFNDVQNFYERRPYPAPLTNLDRHRELYRDPLRRRAQFHLLWPERPYTTRQNILVAGCGTSQAATIAMREPDAHVFAIDSSSTSLENTQALKQKYGLDNLAIHQLGIEAVSALEQEFDQIICTGVLHHLPDPVSGLNALRNVLSQQGAIDVMVYGQYGRTGVYMLQEYCRMLGLATSDRDLDDLRQTLDALSPCHPIAAVMQQTKDFMHPDALADALLHPQDRAYTVPQLYEWLNQAGLVFGRWVDQAAYLPQCGGIARTPHGVRLGKLPIASQYAAMELFRGTMSKHRFIAYREDKQGDSPPIQRLKEGAHKRKGSWRGMIPIRLPWTVCLRDRLPAGAVAVLINRAHTYSDLALPIDEEQDQLWSLMDGGKTLGEIVDFASKAMHHKRAITFVRRLWQYDQIVFDASTA